MRQHVNPLSKHFKEIEPIPLLNDLFKNPSLPLHIDIGCGSGGFLFNLATQNKNWNYLGIEIREKLALNAQVKLNNEDISNLYFVYGNANYLIIDFIVKLPKNILRSISFNFPDPWFKKKHYKRRVLQPELINKISDFMPLGSLIYIKSDVKELFEFMDLSILNSSIFKKIYSHELNLVNTFNPQDLKTEREIYALSNNLRIFERTYKKYF